jgi:RND family efflux transporter MFP subunit
MAVLAGVLAGAGYLGYWGFGQYFGEKEASAASQLFPVRRGDIAETVSSNGSVVYTNRETVSFGAAGTVGEVLAAEGQTVKAGDAIATLDAATLAVLQRAVREAELSLRTAEERVQDLSAPAGALAMAQAEADLLSAQNALKDAERATDATLARAVADAESAVSVAQKKADDLSKPSALAVASAEAELLSAQNALKDAERATDISLARAVADAESAVSVAQKKADDLSKPSALAVASAEAELLSAQNALKDAERATDISLARAVADAESAVSAAQKKADDLSKPPALAVASAEAELALAKAVLRTAEDALADVSSGQTRARAEESLNIARVTFANAKTDLRLAEQGRDDKTLTARTALGDAEANYRSNFAAWTGARIADAQLAKTPEEILAAWGTTYESLVSTSAKDYAPMADDAATPWNEMVLFLWTHLMPSVIKGPCTGAVPSNTRCMQSELEAAWKTLSAAHTSFESAETQQTNAVNAAKNAVTKAEDALDAAQRALDDLMSAATGQSRSADVALAKARVADSEKKAAEVSKVDAVALAAARAQLDESKAKLDSARDALARGESGRRSGVSVAMARVPDAAKKAAEVAKVDAVALAAARAQLDESKAKLDSARDALAGGASGRRSGVSVAKARVTSAEEKLADLKEVGRDALALALARAQVEETKARLGAARDALDGATARAPITGVVSIINVEAGQGANVSTVVAEIVDRSVLEVNAVVDEIDVLSLKVGAVAVIRMDALSGRSLSGTVSEIGDAANSQQGVVSYPIKVKIAVPQGLELREGLSATATVTVSSEQNALLAPVQSIGGSFAKPTVKVMRDGKEQTVEVELGISDESWVAVRRGLQDGDQIVLEGTAAAAADLRLQRQGQLGQGQLFPGGAQQQGRQQIFIGPGGAPGQFQQGGTGQQGGGGQTPGGQRQQGGAGQPGGQGQQGGAGQQGGQQPGQAR